MTLKITQDRLRIEHGLPNNFHFYQWNALRNGKEYVGVTLSGGRCPLLTRGTRKGSPNFAKLTEHRTFTVTKERQQQYESEYEQATGNCRECLGAKQVVRGWSAKDGIEYETCKRCGGSGTAPKAGEPC